MHKQFFATTILAVALVFSQGGSFLVAALCPHLRSGVKSCNPHVVEPAISHHDAMSHHDMGHMQMDSAGHEPASNLNLGEAALDRPMELCAHCAVHSRTTSNAISFRDSEAAKRAGNLTGAITVWKVIQVATSAVAALNSSAHGPPGEHTPRHILINIFRI